MKMFIRVLGLVALMAGLSACDPEIKRPSDEEPAVVEGRDGSGDWTAGVDAGAGEDAGADSRGADAAAKFTGHPLDNPEGPLSERVMYFAYDEHRVDSEYRGVLDAHARYLADNPDSAVVVEGHADERGSREYNIGLGERRALAIRQFLLFQGAGSRQVRVVSYGEERPAVDGHTESAMRLNRRVELNYPGYTRRE